MRASFRRCARVAAVGRAACTWRMADRRDIHRSLLGTPGAPSWEQGGSAVAKSQVNSRLHAMHEGINASTPNAHGTRGGGPLRRSPSGGRARTI
eukprot:5639204-Prymnesium_polylepis.2